MRKINQFILGIFCLSGLLLSCTKENAELTVTPNENNTIISATIVQPELAASTKVGLGEKDENTGITPLLWDAKDAIAISPYKNNQLGGPSGTSSPFFQLQTGAGTSQGKFSQINTDRVGALKALEEGDFYIATNKAWAGRLDDGSIHFAFGNTQNYRPNSIAPLSSLLIGTAASDLNFTFKAYSGILRLNIKGDVKLESIKVITPGVNDQKAVTLTMDESLENIQRVPRADVSSKLLSDYVQLNCKGLQLTDQETAFNISMLPTSTDMTVEINVIKGDGTKATVTKKIKDSDMSRIESGKITIMPLLTLYE